MRRMDRRRFLRTLSCGAVAAATAGRRLRPARAAGEKDARPNIVFLLTDDQRARTLGAAGHPVIRTPNLDRLAAEGVRFTNAFVTDPTCKPSRVTYFTGLYERVHGVGFSTRQQLSERRWRQTYPALMREAGYFTGFIGKFGVESYAFRGRAGEKFDFWRGHDGWARFRPKKLTHCSAYADAAEEFVTPIMGESIDRFLDACPPGKPFCLSVSFSAPHGSISGSMVPGERGDRRMTTPADTVADLAGHPVYGKLYRDRAVEIPAETATDPEPYLPARVLPQAKRRACYSYAYTRPTAREHHYRYYQLITGIDAAVGRLRKGLARRQLAERTVIVFTSDHGLLMGEYGMGGKSLLYDLAVRVPLVIRDPSLPTRRRGKVIDALALSADIAPTLLSYAGIRPPAHTQGRNLRPLLTDPNRPWRDEVFLENLYTGRDNPFIEAVRTRRYKYVRYFANPSGVYTDEQADFAAATPVFEQLFDLRADPAERTNLRADPEHRGTLADLRARCRRHSADQVARRKAYRVRQTVRRDRQGQRDVSGLARDRVQEKGTDR